MPVTPSAPEAVARAVLPETPPAAGAPLTPDQARAKQLREKSTKEGPRPALDSLRQAVERRDIDSLLDKNFGVEVDPATGQKVRAAGSPEEARFNSSKQRAEIISNYLEKGYDGLTAAEKTFVTNEIKNALNAWPPGQQFIDTLAPAEQQELFERILKGQEDGDIKLPATVRKLLEERAQGVIADEVTEKKRKFDELQQKETETQNQLTLKATELTNVSTSLAQFETVAGTPGAKLRELERLQKRSAKLNQDLEEKTDQLETAKGQLNRLENQRDMLLVTGASTTAVDALISIKETAVSGLKTAISQVQQQLDRKQALETEKVSLESRKQTLETERASLQQQLQDAIRQRTSAQADLMKAKIERGEKEEKFADSIKNLFSDASIKYLKDKIQAVDIAEKQRYGEEKARAGDPGEKAVMEEALVRWQRENGQLIEGQIKSDYSNLMNRSPLVGGPDNLTKRMLDAQVTAGKLTAAEANAKKNDPAFLEKMRPGVAQELISQYIKLGKFSEAEAEMIIKTDWGKQVIDNAWQKNESLKNALQGLKEKGIIKGSPLEFLGKLKGKSLLKWLLFLLLGGVVAGVGGPMLLKTLNP